MDRDDHATTMADAPSLVSPPRDDHAPHRQGWTERYAAGRSEDEVRGDVWRDFDLGWVMVCELLGATLTWGGIGWLADRWLGTAPLLLSLGFVLGFVTGFYLLWARSTGRVTVRTPRSRETSQPPAPTTSGVRDA